MWSELWPQESCSQWWTGAVMWHGTVSTDPDQYSLMQLQIQADHKSTHISPDYFRDKNALMCYAHKTLNLESYMGRESWLHAKWLVSSSETNQRAAILNGASTTERPFSIHLYLLLSHSKLLPWVSHLIFVAECFYGFLQASHAF